MHEVVTIVEATVDEKCWKLLQEAYAKETGKLPLGIKQTQLIQSQQVPHKWRIVTHWRSQEALDHMRATVEVPVALKVFRAAKATPSLEIWHLKMHRLGQALQ